MHIELTEILTCPRCGPGHGMIAFVERLEERRIMTGRLDCPACEERHEIRDGAVRLSSETSIAGAVETEVDDEGGDDVDVGDSSAAQARPPASGQTAAALLGPPADDETVLLAGGAVALAPAVAGLREGAAVVTYGKAPPTAHERLYPVLAADIRPGVLPFRSRSLDGVVLQGEDRSLLDEAARILRPGGRLVVLAPGGEVSGDDIRELAADARAWVGVAPGG